MKDDSYCKKDVLCDFRIEKEYHDALVEVCVQCGKRIVYPKPVNQEKYNRDHKRMTLQPSDDYDLFVRIYGTKGIEEMKRQGEKFVDKKKRGKIMEELRDRRIAMRRRAFRGLGKTEKEITNIPKHISKRL